VIARSPLRTIAASLLSVIFRPHRVSPPFEEKSDGICITNGLCNLSKLSVWWLRLGIAIARIKPGHPQQNGRHKRMHLTLKKEATRTAGMNSLQQQARFYDFIHKARDVATGLIGVRSLESVVLLTGDRGFESISLQRGVKCEPDRPLRRVAGTRIRQSGTFAV
jgi:transposase InsO family protein